jgi:hypothetical protein
VQIVEVALLALAGLVQENPPTAVALSRPGPEGGPIVRGLYSSCADLQQEDLCYLLRQRTANPAS